MMSRRATYEPLAASKLIPCSFSLGPWSYATTALIFAFGMYAYDYWRRAAMEQVMWAEEHRQHHCKLKLVLIIFPIDTVKALNHVRVGEEQEITNLVDYLSSTTVRP